MDKPIIFLDIDYVVNGRETEEKVRSICGVDPEKLKLLKNLIDYSPAKIILTSSWRRYWNESLINDGINWEEDSSPEVYGRYLNAKFAEQGLFISGKIDESHWSRRSRDVLSWIQKHDVHKLVIFDDQDFGWEGYHLDEFWVDTAYTDGWLKLDGITEAHIEKAKEILDEKYYKG